MEGSREAQAKRCDIIRCRIFSFRGGAFARSVSLGARAADSDKFCVAGPVSIILLAQAVRTIYTGPKSSTESLKRIFLSA
jgi:hypothetical protein